ncbi:MAG: hypothetical protein AABW52_02425 [Nanoarchaeota archaeon]
MLFIVFLIFLKVSGFKIFLNHTFEPEGERLFSDINITRLDNKFNNDREFFPNDGKKFFGTSAHFINNTLIVSQIIDGNPYRINQIVSKNDNNINIYIIQKTCKDLCDDSEIPYRVDIKSSLYPPENFYKINVYFVFEYTKSTFIFAKRYTRITQIISQEVYNEP